MDDRTDLSQRQAERRKRWTWLAVAFIGLSIALIALATTCLVTVKSTIQGSATSDQFAQMHAAIQLVQLPAGYRLAHTQDVGAAGFLGGDQPPEEVRVYAISVTHPARTARALRATFVAAGFKADRLFHCAFSAFRGPVQDFVEYYRTPTPPLAQGAPECPNASWPGVYAYTVLSLVAV